MNCSSVEPVYKDWKEEVKICKNKVTKLFIIVEERRIDDVIGGVG